MHIADEVVVSEMPVATPLRARVRWDALVAGLFVVAATGWVLTLLGSALGVSVADASDAERVSAGFAISLVVWIAFSWWTAYVAGAYVTTRLSGTARRETAALQSVTLWALGASITFLLGFLGVTGVAAGALKAAGTVGKVATAVAGSATIAASDAREPRYPSEVTNGAMAAIKREAARIASENASGEDVSPERIRLAMDELDAESTSAIATELVLGRDQSAKDILTARTNLTDREVDAIVTGAKAAIAPRVAEAKAKLDRAMEAASTYANAALWTTFAGAAIALLAALLGGLAGLEIPDARTVPLTAGRVAAATT